jgi:hypothetical protein
MAANPDQPLSTSDLAGRNRPTGDTGTGHTHDAVADDRQPLLPATELDGLRTRWDDIQTGFVDEPREAVAEADGLVAEVMQELADTFARERSQLETQWDRGEAVSTEELRVALQRYRSFFNRLLQT